VLADGIFAHLEKRRGGGGGGGGWVRVRGWNRRYMLQNLGEELRLVRVGLFVELFGETLDSHTALLDHRGPSCSSHGMAALQLVGSRLCFGFLEHFRGER
jgi:hypothetical protein